MMWRLSAAEELPAHGSGTDAVVDARLEANIGEPRSCGREPYQMLPHTVADATTQKYVIQRPLRLWRQSHCIHARTAPRPPNSSGIVPSAQRLVGQS